jgi:hypothetical protein
LKKDRTEGIRRDRIKEKTRSVKKGITMNRNMLGCGDI